MLTCLADQFAQRGAAQPRHRKRWPGFAARWDAVLAEAYASLEIAALQNAENLFSTPDYVPETNIRGMTVEHAMRLLHIHKNRLFNIGRGPAGQRWRRPPTLEEVRGSILKKVEAIVRARALDEAARAARAADWAKRRKG